MATKVEKANLTPYGGVKNGSFVDFEIQEINLRTGKLVFAWDMGEHIPLGDSIVPAPTSASQIWDAYHLNSIDEAPTVCSWSSARLVVGLRDQQPRDSGAGGKVLWQLGGKPTTDWPQFSVTNDITGPV